MPPKRGRGGARGGARAASRTPGPRESTPLTNSLGSQQTPGPPKFSTSYGSPAVPTASRAFKSGSAANAMSNVLKSVQAADMWDRALNGTEEESNDSPDEDDDVRAPSGSAPASRQASNAPRRAQHGDEDDVGFSDTDEEDDAARMPPPSHPYLRSTNGITRPAVPESDTRSFTEESQLFRGAGLGTPRPTSRSARQETPSRSSARIAAKNDSTGSQAVSLADLVENREAEFANLATQAVRAKSVSAEPPKTSRSGLTDQTSRSRGRPRDFISDDVEEQEEEEEEEEEETPRHQSQRNGDSQQTASPKTEAQTGNEKPTMPINPHIGVPIGQGGHSNPFIRSALQVGQPGDPAPRPPRASGHLTNSTIGGRPNVTSSRRPENPLRGDRPDALQSPGGANHQHDNDQSDEDQYHNYQYANDDELEGLFPAISNGLERIFQFSKWPRWLATGVQVWGLLAFFSIASLILLQVFVPPNRWEGVKVSRNYTYTGVGNWRQNIAQFVPWVVLHPFAVLTGNLDYVDFRTALQWAEWNHQNNKFRLDYLAGATFEMRRILPELIAIKMDKSSNEWSVGDTFWTALDEQMKHGGLHHSILTLERSADGSYIITDNHWDAILRRIQSEGMLISSQPEVGDDDVTYSDQIKSVVERTVSQRWDQWVKKNDDAIKRVVGIDKETMSAYYTEIFGDFEQKMLESVRSHNQEEQLISKEEFIEKIKHVSNEYDVQIRAEMEAMEDRLRHAIDIAEEGKQTAVLPEGLDRQQVSDMIDMAIKRAIADAQLEFIAKGNIKGHLEAELSGHKNYFSAVRGAIIDHTLSSSSFKWSERSIMGEEKPDAGGLFSIFSRNRNPAFTEGGKTAPLAFSPGKVLEKWDEDGECWCAGHSDTNNSSRIADLSILTADIVIPQHLVVEHITASGSFDPEAMPKDLEVWIRTPSDRRRRTLLEWSANIWSDAKFGNGARLMGMGFVKIGEFQYLNAVGKGEKQVFRLSEDLIGLDAQTQQVIVRSKSNYGAQDHTCFYRLQLFGEEGKGVDRGAVE